MMQQHSSQLENNSFGLRYRQSERRVVSILQTVSSSFFWKNILKVVEADLVVTKSRMNDIREEISEWKRESEAELEAIQQTTVERLASLTEGLTKGNAEVAPSATVNSLETVQLRDIFSEFLQRAIGNALATEVL